VFLEQVRLPNRLPVLPEAVAPILGREFIFLETAENEGRKASAAGALRTGRRGMFKGQFGITGLFDFDDEGNPSLGIAEGERLAGVLHGDGIHYLEIGIRPTLDDTSTNLHLGIGVTKIHDGDRHPRVARCIYELSTNFPRYI
jgi:hypothetical protein